jgi:hypothetical protein
MPIIREVISRNEIGWPSTESLSVIRKTPWKPDAAPVWWLHVGEDVFLIESRNVDVLNDLVHTGKVFVLKDRLS